MSHSTIKSQRRGRNLYNYSSSSLSWKGGTRRNTFIGQDCIQNRLSSESYMRHSNYDGRTPPEVKKCTTLSRAIAVEEQRRRPDTPTLRARPGYLGEAGAAEGGEAPPPQGPAPAPATERGPRAPGGAPSEPKASSTKFTWIDTRQQQTPPQQHRAAQEPPPHRGPAETHRGFSEPHRAVAQETHRGPQEPHRAPQEAAHRGPPEPRRASPEPRRGPAEAPQRRAAEPPQHRGAAEPHHHQRSPAEPRQRGAAEPARHGPARPLHQPSAEPQHRGAAEPPHPRGAWEPHRRGPPDSPETQQQPQQQQQQQQPPQGHPQQSHPQQSHPQQSHPQQGHHPQGHHPQGHHQQGHNGQQHRPQQQQQQQQHRAESPGQIAEPDRRAAAPAKLASPGSQSQPVLSPASRRAASPSGPQEKPSSPRVPPGSDTGNSFMRFSSASTRSPRPGSSVYSDNLDTSRMSQALSASGGSLQFGSSGERLDPRKWSTVAVPGIVADRTKRGKAGINPNLHEVLVDQLKRRRALADDTEKEELDKELMCLMHERRCGSPGSPRPMSTAFTDRSLRKREGLATRAALAEDDQSGSGAGQSDCGCAQCKPNLVNPAGQPSHSVHTNVPNFVHAGDAPSTPHTPRQTGAHQGRRMPGSPNYNSNRVGRLIQESPQSPQSPSADALDECSLPSQLGSKTKQSACRSKSADPTTAGRYRRKMDMDLETSPHFRIRAEGCFDTRARNEVSMVLSPRQGDPPRPTRITSCKKADGENKHKLSHHSEKISVHWNQTLYRYECASVKDQEGPPRSTSLPSESFPTVLPIGEGSPRRREEWSEGSAGDYTRLGFGAGGRRSPRVTDVGEVARVTNHEHLAECAVRDRADRLANDPRFSNLCAVTQEVSRAQSRELHTLKEKYTTEKAKTMVDALAWHE